MATEKKLDAEQVAATKESTGAVTLKLRKPLEYNGQTYESITLDLENLTGKDSMEVENELIQRKKGAVIVGALNGDYMMGIASKACAKAGQPLGTDAFMQLSLKDFNRVKDTVRNFLLA